MTLPPSTRDAMLAAIPKLRAYAISLCRSGDQADDLVQETLLRACGHIGLFQSGTNMSAWLFTILRNCFYTECRRRRRVFESIDDHPDSVALKPTQFARTEYDELCGALTKLQPKHREALILVAASGLSYNEAAVVARCPVGTIKSRVNRAREQLAQLLGIDDTGDLAEDSIFSAVVTGADRAAMPVL